MYGLENRIKRLTDELFAVLYRPLPAKIAIEMREGKIEYPCDVAAIDDGYAPFPNGGLFADTVFDKYALFRFDLALPPVAEGEDLFLSVATNQSGQNMVRPQMLLYANGKALQGLDTNHTRVRVTSLAGKTVRFHVYAYSGQGLPTPYGEFADLNRAIGVRLTVGVQARAALLADYCYSVKTATAYLGHFGENTREHQAILHAVNDSLSFLDLRDTNAPTFLASVAEANAYLQTKLYNKEYNEAGEATLVGHTHIDLAWLWQYRHTRDKALRSFATEVKLLGEYEDHRFMSSQAQLYEYVKEQDGELYGRICDLIAQGRWEAEGAMWVEPDMNLASGESIVRQLLYGKRFFKEEFGVESEVLWLPDVFGYSAALPQILKKAGVKYFMTGKLATNERNRFPFDTFLWRGIDGSEVFSCQTRGYNPNVEGGAVLSFARNYAQKDINDDILVPFGYADGGGGPTAEMIETVKRMKMGLPGVPKMKFGTVKDYFRRLYGRVGEHRRLPVWSGEIYYEKHRGTYTSMARIKRQNRKCELLYRNAEWLFCLADCFKRVPFPREKFDRGMKNMLLNQFHDVLPGSSIKAVYDDSDRLYGEAFAIGEEIKADALGRAVAGEGVTVFNPWCRPACGYVMHEGERYFVANVPALGGVSMESPASAPAVPVRAEGYVVESGYYRVTFSPRGTISSLYDKRAGRECFKPGAEANRLRVYEDKPGLMTGYREDNWNLDSYYTEREYEMPAPVKCGLWKACDEYAVFRTERIWGNSRITQDTVIYARSPRIDFETELDWKENGQVLKAEFPMDVNAVRATYEIQFGHIERPTTKNTSWEEAKFEVCGHKWADVSDGGYGMALLNDCKYGYSAEGSTVALTLLRCGDSPNPDADKEKHVFTYSILPHKGDHREGNVVEEGYLLNNPFFAVKGKLPQGAFSLFDCRGAVLETVKPAEDGRGYILRFYESENTSGAVSVACGMRVLSAEFTDLLERPLGEAPALEGKTISFRIKPFEIVTVRVIV